jgi:uncharacterized protein
MFLSRIFVYPIKSAGGIEVSTAFLETSGPSKDRRWMLIDADGLFLSQRKVPRMALIKPRFDGPDLAVEAPGMPPLVIPPWSGEGDWISVQIWRDSLRLPHPNQSYSDWFSEFLERPCRLVHLPDSVTRGIEPPFEDTKWRVSLADGYPLLLITQESLDLLNQRLPSPVEMERFRPNLVIADAAPHEEDTWASVQIGSVEIAVVKPCARCSIVLVDPRTGRAGLEPLKTLAGYRRMPRSVLFAQNALIVNGGHLRVGTPVNVSYRENVFDSSA